MEPNRLLGDEITYELQIRGLPIGGTVAMKRCSLREVLRLERIGESIPPSEVNLDVNSEFSICEGKLDDLSEDIKNFNVCNKENEFKRIHSRLIHLKLRIGRLNGDNDVIWRRTSDLNWCNQLFDVLSKAYSGMERTTSHSHSILDEAVPILTEISEPEKRSTVVQNNLIYAGDNCTMMEDIQQNFKELRINHNEDILCGKAHLNSTVCVEDLDPIPGKQPVYSDKSEISSENEHKKSVRFQNPDMTCPNSSKNVHLTDT